MTKDQLLEKYHAFLDQYLGQSKGYPNDSSYKGQCLSIVKIYIKEVLGLENPPASGSGSAYGYWSNFPSPLDTVLEKVDNTPTSVPQEGDIIVWQPWKDNQYGHIAIFKEGNLKSFKSYDQNWTSKVFQEESHNYNNVIGYLRPRINQEVGSGTEELAKQLEELRLKYAALEAVIPEKNAAISQLTENLKEKDTEVGKLQEKNISLTKEIMETKNILKISQENAEAYLADNKEKTKKLEFCQKELETAKKTAGNLEEELEKITKENSANWKRYKEARDEINKLKKEKDISALSTKELLMAIIKHIFSKKSQQ